MKTTTVLTIVMFGLIFCLFGPTKAWPIGTAWTYQGRLMDANEPADGEYDFHFKLYDAPNGGVQQGSTIDVNDVDVIDGYFTVELDFGASVFDGNDRWLQIGVRQVANPFTILSPRQEVTPTPYALYAKTTENAIIGSGTTNRIAKFTRPNTLGDSALYEDNYYVGVGTASPRGMFDVDCDGGDIYLDTFSAKIYIGDVDGDGDETLFTVDDNAGKFTFENGNVGIGTKFPNKKLTVQYGDFAVYPGPSEPSIITDGYNVKLGDPDGIGNQVFLEVDDSGNKFIFNNGKVGIGTTTPRASLEVTNSGSSHAIWASTSDIPVYAHRTSTGGTWPAVAGDCNSEANGASGVRGRILSTSPGSLGAGVYGYNYGTGSNGVGVRGHHAGSGYAGYFTGGKNYFQGNVGIGTTSPAERLHVAGNLKVNGTITNGPGNIKTPIAYGVINADGTVLSASSNVSNSFWNNTLYRYEITISGESLDTISYVFNVTYINLNVPRFITASVENERLIVEIWSPSSTKAAGRFHFVVYKI